MVFIIGGIEKQNKHDFAPKDLASHFESYEVLKKSIKIKINRKFSII